MKKLAIYIESNINADANLVSDLLKAHPFPCDYELIIKPEYPYQYQKKRKPLLGAFFANSPIYCMHFYYHFVNSSDSSNEDFKQLEAFAKAYQPYVKKVLTEHGSEQLQDKLNKTENSAKMVASNVPTDLAMSNMRFQLENYNPKLFKSIPSQKKKSKLPYVLCGFGVFLGLAALFAPGWIALGLALLSAAFLIAGTVSLSSSSKFKDEEPRLNFSPI